MYRYGGEDVFVGRDKEIAYLNAWYQKNPARPILIYGVHGCGKTALLREFARNKTHFYYAARACTDDLQRQMFLALLKADGAIDNWEAALAAIPPQTLLILDDFQNMAKNPTMVDAVKKLAAKCRIILCADSSMDMDVDAIPMYPMPFYEAIGFFPRFAPFDQMMLYASFGGLPEYLSHIDTTLTMEQNIKQKLLDFRAPLFYEADRLMTRDLREPAIHNTIMAAIAAGCSTVTELHNVTGLTISKVSVYFRYLTGFGLLERETPISPAGPLALKKTTGKYVISNHLLRFWFTFVFPNLPELLWGDVDGVYRYKIAPAMDQYIADIFVEICTDYLRVSNENGLLPFKASHIGRWWRGGQTLDILATTGNKGEILMGLCQYQTDLMDTEAYDNAMKYFNAVNPDGPGLRYLFCNVGFDNEVREKAKTDGVTLIGFYGRVIE